MNIEKVHWPLLVTLIYFSCYFQVILLIIGHTKNGHSGNIVKPSDVGYFDKSRMYHIQPTIIEFNHHHHCDTTNINPSRCINFVPVHRNIFGNIFFRPTSSASSSCLLYQRFIVKRQQQHKMTVCAVKMLSSFYSLSPYPPYSYLQHTYHTLVLVMPHRCAVAHR